MAALLLLCRELLPWAGWPKTAAAALALCVGASKSQAYEMLDRLRAMLPTLLGAPGRPASQPAPSGATMNVLLAMRDYLMSHPGALCGRERRTYTDDFRRFVVGLVARGAPGEGLSVDQLSWACGVPLGTLKDWLNPERPETSEPVNDEQERPSPKLSIPDLCRAAHIREIVTHWLSWKGTFLAFCQMLRVEHRLTYGATFIGTVLQSLGLRQRRPRVPVQAPWSRGAFRILFPGAQWLGDGSVIALRWGQDTFKFNLELILDPAADAAMGLSITDAENEEALRLAYEQGRDETASGQPPLAVTLDNKACNHSPAARADLADTTVLRATKARGQSKAPLEGAFGLFQQGMPPLVVTGDTPRDKARSVLELVATAWFRGRNGKPRKKLNGLTPAEAYLKARPTSKEIQAAREWFQELVRRQERANLTREARRDPVRLKLVSQGLAELGIPDPEGRLAVSFAGYAREAIVRGLASFRAKQELEIIPADVANYGAYLGGTIRQLHIRMELEVTAKHLLEQRLRLRDLTLRPLQRDADELRVSTSTPDLPQAFTDRALGAACEVDFRFWGHAAAQALSTLPPARRETLYPSLSRRVAASFKTDWKRRQDLIDWLAEVVAASG